jgi:hypothetical protein
VGAALRPRLQAVAELPVGEGRQLPPRVGEERRLPLRVAEARLRPAVVALPQPVARQGEEAGLLPGIAGRRQVTEMPWAVVPNRIMPGWNTGPMAVKFPDEPTGNPETSMSLAAMDMRWISITD